MADEFYLPEETLEWIGQKKSELLAWVVEHRHENDIPFEEYSDYADKLTEALTHADETWQQKWDGHTVQVKIKMFENPQHGMVWLFVVSLMAPVLNEDPQDEVMVPVLVLPTRQTIWLKQWLKGEKLHGQQVH